MCVCVYCLNKLNRYIEIYWKDPYIYWRYQLFNLCKYLSNRSMRVTNFAYTIQSVHYKCPKFVIVRGQFMSNQFSNWICGW